ncbi:hypothetical protein Bca52824_036987 [Brassica carinata]|uniref:Uncharacterized protein n=1 Tax=Brassica carinata TaxID=52824 RepID=A0A8X7S5X5_BRACI|nr:hypothetical protein Bca52824_036987 [Brassica carinata]
MDIVPEKNDAATKTLSSVVQVDTPNPEMNDDARVTPEAHVVGSDTEKDDRINLESSGVVMGSITEGKTENGSALGAPEVSSWLDISPSKKGRSASKSVETHIVGSPSRFAILSDEHEEAEEDTNPSPKPNDDPATEIQATLSQKENGESEEGEIVEASSTSTNLANQEETRVAEEQSIRRTSNRVSKGINRNSAESFAQSTKETLLSDTDYE